MPTKHDLPGGNWVKLKDPLEVTERARKPLRRAFQATVRGLRGPAPKRGADVVDSPDPTAAPQVDESDILEEERLDMLDRYQYQAMAFFVTDWSFAFEPSPETIQDLPAPCYSELDALTGPLVHELIHGLKPEPTAEPEEIEESHPSEP